ncbi:MAG: zf-HC2 domain-containing protein [Planctomycetes bacterium]|nr:zf-HC2 domain-containing protein [Planctomycetota bacterium]
MRCPEVRDLLHAFLDGELEVDKNVAMLKHLELCPPCRERSGCEQELREVVVRACCEPVAPERARALLAAACRPGPDALGGDAPAAAAPRVPSRRWRRWSAAAAVVALIGGAGAWALRAPCPGSDCSTRSLLAWARAQAQLEPPLPLEDLYERLGERFDAPAPAGLTLLGGNTLTIDGQRAPLLRYRCDCDGKVVVVARVPGVHVHGRDVRRLADGRSYVVVEHEGAKLVGWQGGDGGLWCVIGCEALPRERLYVLASAMRG